VTSAAIRTFLRVAPPGTIGLTLPTGLFVAEVGGRRLLESPSIRRALLAGRAGRLRLWCWRAANAPGLGGRPVVFLLRVRYGSRATALMRRLRALKLRLR
jgi:hypothetical protein